MTLRITALLFFCVVSFAAFAQTPAQPSIVAAADQVDVPVLTRDVATGDLIGEADITYATISVVRANASIVRSPAEIAGRKARRYLRAGELIRASDIKLPTLVAKGDTVTMIFEVPGLSLTAQGRAMNEGGMGDSIAILNPVSHRQVDALVVGTGTVRVGPSPAMAAMPNGAKLASAQP